MQASPNRTSEDDHLLRQRILDLECQVDKLQQDCKSYTERLQAEESKSSHLASVNLSMRQSITSETASNMSSQQGMY